MLKLSPLGLGLALMLAGTFTAGSAAAGQITVGNPAVPNSGTSLPFGSAASAWGGEYQQAYDYTQFGATQVAISGITFHTTQYANRLTSAVSTGVYTISVSSATTDFFSLSSNLASNIGADNSVVYSGALPMLAGHMLTIQFSHPFLYDPTAGHDLLLDVVSADAANADPLYFDYTAGAGPAGIVTARVDRLIGFGDQIGLVTTFAVPEPATMAVLGSGLLGLLGARRRRG